MLEELQSRLPMFRTRLTETVVWCLSQSLESNPAESAEIKKRRRLGEEAGKLSRRGYQSRLPLWGSYLKRCARRLYDRAKLFEVTPLAHQLRSPLFRPARFIYPQSDTERLSIVENLAEKRAAQLRLLGLYPSTLLGDLSEGRLLLYAPNENLCDGAAKYASKGFFDVDNIPPWDTWVCSFAKYLVSWVPPQFIELANQGVDANPEQCILWAPQTGLPNA